MLINTYVTQRFTVVSDVSVNASRVISLEYIWTTMLFSYLWHIVSFKKGHSLHLALFVSKSKKKKKKRKNGFAGFFKSNVLSLLHRIALKFMFQ